MLSAVSAPKKAQDAASIINAVTVKLTILLQQNARLIRKSTEHF